MTWITQPAGDGQVMFRGLLEGVGIVDVSSPAFKDLIRGQFAGDRHVTLRATVTDDTRISFLSKEGNGSRIAPTLVVEYSVPPPMSFPTGAPDLIGQSDTGNSPDDNLTKLANSDQESRLAFDIRGTVPSATVRLFSDGIEIGSAVATGAETRIVTDGSTRLLDGTVRIYARQTEPGKLESDQSPSLMITVDTTAPTANISELSRTTRDLAVDIAIVEFSEAVDDHFLSDYRLSLDGGNVSLLSSAATLTQIDFGMRWRLNGLGALTSNYGAYRLSIDASSATLTDLAGNAPVGIVERSWHVVLGDADGDEDADLTDFGILKAHFGAGNARSEGDFDGDGTVNLTDFGILKAKFGSTGQ